MVAWLTYCLRSVLISPPSGIPFEKSRLQNTVASNTNQLSKQFGHKKDGRKSRCENRLGCNNVFQIYSENRRKKHYLMKGTIMALNLQYYFL